MEDIEVSLSTLEHALQLATASIPDLLGRIEALGDVLLVQLLPRACGGEIELDTLRGWIERLVCVALAVLKSPGLTGAEMDSANMLIVSLTSRSLIFAEQPPQVLKTTVKFTARVVCLAGNALDFSGAGYPMVELQLLSEPQARVVDNSTRVGSPLPEDGFTGGCCGQLANGTAELSFDHNTGCMAAGFRGTSLRSIKRGTSTRLGAGALAVTDEKFCLMAKTILPGPNGALSAVTLTRPIVVIVHGAQLNAARATVLWDSAFANEPRLPFEVPAEAPWATVARLLSDEFERTAGTALNEAQLMYLGEKLAGGGGGGVPATVSWASFKKTPLPGRSFTFWDWFCGVADLVGKFLQAPWSAGAVAGFLNKDDVQHLLGDRPPGTFVLRFSESALGGITVSWAGTDAFGLPQVLHLQPWYPKDFAIRSLADRLHDLMQLQWLYPDVPKQEIFPVASSERTAGLEAGSSYVPWGLANVISGAATGGCGGMAGNTFANDPDLQLEMPARSIATAGNVGLACATDIGSRAAPPASTHDIPDADLPELDLILQDLRATAPPPPPQLQSHLQIRVGHNADSGSMSSTMFPLRTQRDTY